MLNVGTNVFGNPLANAEGAPAGTLPGSPFGNSAATSRGAAADNIASPFGPGAAATPIDSGAPGGAFGLSGFLGQFMSMIESAFSQLAALFSQSFGGNIPSTAPGGSPGNEQYFANASASSVGDPHDAFNGTTGSGQTENAKWNNMNSHADLLHSDSFAGGFRVSTTVGAPNAHGVTQNESATITSNNGQNVITMNADGTCGVTAGGRSLNLCAGQTIALGNGESATMEAGGAVRVSQTNAQGGTLTTTLTANGKGGVNVEASAHDVDLGGYLVDGSSTSRPGGSPQPFVPGGSPQPFVPGGFPQPFVPGGAPGGSPGGSPGATLAPPPLGAPAAWNQPLPTTWSAPQIPMTPAGVPADPLDSPAELLGA